MRKYKQEYYRRPEAKQHQKKYLAEYNRVRMKETAFLKALVQGIHQRHVANVAI